MIASSFYNSIFERELEKHGFNSSDQQAKLKPPATKNARRSIIESPSGNSFVFRNKYSRILSLDEALDRKTRDLKYLRRIKNEITNKIPSNGVVNASSRSILARDTPSPIQIDLKKANCSKKSKVKSNSFISPTTPIEQMRFSHAKFDILPDSETTVNLSDNKEKPKGPVIVVGNTRRSAEHFITPLKTKFELKGTITNNCFLQLKKKSYLSTAINLKPKKKSVEVKLKVPERLKKMENRFCYDKMPPFFKKSIPKQQIESEEEEKELNLLQSDANVGHFHKDSDEALRKDSEEDPLRIKLSRSGLKFRKDSSSIKKREAPQNELLSMEEVEKIKKSLSETRSLNLSECEIIIRKLSYFQKFTPFFRRKILSKCKFFQYDRGHIIFRKGDVGDFLYIILRGAVSIEIEEATYGKLPVKIKSLYDGSYFGDLTVFANTYLKGIALRTATVSCCETTYLLGINQEDMQNVFIDKNEKLQLYHFYYLRSLSIFENLDDISVANISRNVISLNFNIGETIIKRGTIPKGMFIVVRGTVSIMREDFTTRSYSADQKERDYSNTNRLKYLEKFYEYKQLPNNKFRYLTQQLVKHLREGSIFCGYSIILEGNASFEKRVSKEMVYSAVAESERVEVWLLEKSILTFFHNENIQQNFFHLIEKFDFPNPPKGLTEASNEMREWNKFKRSVIEKINN